MSSVSRIFPGGHGRFCEVVLVVAGEVAAVVAFEIVPQIFDRKVPVCTTSRRLSGSRTSVMLSGIDNERLR